MIGLDTPADTAGTSALGRSSHPEQQTQSSGLQGSVSASSRRAATPHQQQLRPVAEDSRGGLPAVGGTVSGPPAGFDAPGDPCPVGSLGLRARSSGNAGSVSAASTTAELRTHSGAATGMVAYRNNGVERTTGGNGANRQGPDPDLSANPGPGGSQHARNNGMAAAAIGGPTRQAVTTINQLHKASVVGDLIAISRFIREGGNLEAQSFCGRTALHYAAFYGHADVARALIIGGANVCSRGGGNSTPLHFAAWGGNKGVVRLLLDYGADVEAHDTEGNAPQAYSEDDDLFKMLVDARRKAFPVPLKSISSALESRPIASLGVYVTVIVSVASVAIGLVLAWVSGEAGSAQSVAMMGTMGSSVGGARVLGAGESAGGGANSDSVESIMDGRDVESVPVTALLWMMGGSLALGLAPSLILAVGYKRRTAAFWRSVRERDMEILRRQEHLLQPRLSPVAVSAPPGFDPASANVSVGPAMDVVGGSRPSTGATTGIGTGGGPIATPAASATSAVDPVIESAPRQISRGEQAVQEIVMARLSRLQQPPPGGAAPPRVTPVLHPRGLSLHAAPYAHRQALQPADFARHQHDVRNSPAVAVAGTTLPPGGYIYGMAGNGATLAMAGGVGRGMGYGSGMGGAAIPEGVGGPVAPSHSGGGSGGRPVQSIQVPQ